MASASNMPFDLKARIAFVKLCTSEFGWRDLSEERIMDVGCGQGLYCSRAILENFPEVKSIIALDVNRAELEAVTFTSPKIARVLADIQKREHINMFEGKIDKVISFHVLHQIPDKQVALKNIYRLLKPGGEAALLFFSDLGLYYVIKDLGKDPKFKDYFKGSDITEIYSGEFKAHHYRHMLEEIGFNVKGIEEKMDIISRSSFDYFTNSLREKVAKAFSAPPEVITEIKDIAIYIYRRMFLNDRSCYLSTEMCIFLTKPHSSSVSSSS